MKAWTVWLGSAEASCSRHFSTTWRAGQLGKRGREKEKREGAYLDQIVDKDGKIGDAAVDVGRLVDADEGLVEDGEDVAEELEGDGLLDQVQHHGLVALAGLELHQLLQVREELGALLELVVDVLDCVVESDVGIVETANLVGLERGLNEVGAQDGDDEVDVVGGSLLADGDFEVLLGVRVLLELLDKDGVTNLDGEGVDGLLEVLDAVVQREGEYALHEGARAEGLGEEDIQDVGHDGGRVGDADDVLDDGVGNQRVDPLSLREELGRVVLGQEEVVDGGGHLDAQPFGELLILDAEVLDRLLLLDLLEKHGEPVTLYDVLSEPARWLAEDTPQ